MLRVKAGLSDLRFCNCYNSPIIMSSVLNARLVRATFVIFLMLCTLYWFVLVVSFVPLFLW